MDRLRKKRGFTLIELMVALGVIAILSVTVILVINPVNLLKEGRDSQRIADLAQMNRAMSLYIANVGSFPSTLSCPSSGTGSCYVGLPVGMSMVTGAPAALIPRCGQRYKSTQNPATATSASQVITGTGWIPVNLTDISVGVPIVQWPMDPKTLVLGNGSTTNPQAFLDTSYYYSFACYNNSWEFTANMEAPRYSGSSTAPTYGTDMVEENDDGTDFRLLEVGTNVGL